MENIKLEPIMPELEKSVGKKKFKKFLNDINGNAVTKNDLIKRKDAVLSIQKYGVGCLNADEFSPEECERFVIKNLNSLEGVEYNPMTDYRSAWTELFNFVISDNAFINDASKAVLLAVENKMKALKDKYTKEI